MELRWIELRWSDRDGELGEDRNVFGVGAIPDWNGKDSMSEQAMLNRLFLICHMKQHSAMIQNLDHVLAVQDNHLI